MESGKPSASNRATNNASMNQAWPVTTAPRRESVLQPGKPAAPRRPRRSRHTPRSLLFFQCGAARDQRQRQQQKSNDCSRIDQIHAHSSKCWHTMRTAETSCGKLSVRVEKQGRICLRPGKSGVKDRAAAALWPLRGKIVQNVSKITGEE